MQVLGGPLGHWANWAGKLPSQLLDKLRQADHATLVRVPIVKELIHRCLKLLPPIWVELIALGPAQMAYEGSDCVKTANGDLCESAGVAGSRPKWRAKSSILLKLQTTPYMTAWKLLAVQGSESS